MKKKKNKKDKVNPVTLPLLRLVASVMEGEYSLDRLLEKTFREHRDWSDTEKRYVLLTAGDMVRNWRLIYTASGEPVELDDHAMKKIFLAWQLMKRRTISRDESKKYGVNEAQVKDRMARYARIRKITASYTDWMDARASEELGKDWDVLAPELSKAPLYFIRANTWKISREELLKKLAEENIEAVMIPSSADAIQVLSAGNLFRTESFRSGLFEMQDLSSQQVAHFLDPKPGMRVVDACAGAGGKSLHLAALMRNKGKVISLDTQQYKLNELQKRAVRAGLSIVETRLLDSSKVIKRLEGSADALLLDVPCSGTGVLRRNPDIKWKLDQAALERLWNVQKEILETYTCLVRPGGFMVYSTCSILPSEGEKQIKSFLEKNSGWELLIEKRISPLDFSSDGFYMARLKRNS